MEIVVLDGYTENPGDLSWDAVKSFGTLTVYDRTPADDAIICKRIGNADIVITNKTPISAYVIASCPSIKFISVLATGYNLNFNFFAHRIASSNSSLICVIIIFFILIIPCHA